jgi:multiple sugar transport system permease protein
MLATGLANLYESSRRWWGVMLGGSSSDTFSLAPMAFLQQMNATGVLMCLAPMIILYLIAQKAFVESLSQTGIKM